MCHVLIIEDEAIIAADIEGLLSAHGATSFSFAQTEIQAVEEAHRRRPEFITADVNLELGTGPKAVARIEGELGPIPTIFITASPEQCIPCEPPHRVHTKPINEALLITAFGEMRNEPV